MIGLERGEFVSRVQNLVAEESQPIGFGIAEDILYSSARQWRPEFMEWGKGVSTVFRSQDDVQE
jgi:hypothetical protein